MNNGLEIERKFLIKYPDTKLLLSLKGCKKVDIAQTYLADRRRIRRWCEDGRVSFILTYKEKITELTRIEKESKITEEEYTSLLRLRDPERETVFKTRYRFPYASKVIEIDVFPFWSDRAFLEVELKSEDEEFCVPPFIEIIKEVSEDKHYRNSALAKEIPFDDI